MVQLVWHLWDAGKRDQGDVKHQALEQAELFGRAVPAARNPPEGLCVPGLLAAPGSLGKTNGQKHCLGLISGCVKKEQSDFSPEPPERAKQLTSKLTLSEVHYEPSTRD